MLGKTMILGTLLSLGLSASPAIAQRLSCVRVQDPDGWVNVRNVSTGEVVGSLRNDTRFVHRGVNRDGYAVLVSSPNLMVHNSRLEVSPNRYCNEFWTVRDPDGWSNVRSSPGGEVIEQVNTGRRVLRVGRDGDWEQIITPNGRFGYIHQSRLTRRGQW